MKDTISPCYEIETRKYSDGLLDVSATYIIHLTNNGRERDIETQLSQLHPSHLVHIVHNAGYKKCAKALEVQSPPYDLTDAFMTVFRDAQRRGYGDILILEDDFQFDVGEMHTHAPNINRFMHSHPNELYVYRLGVMPIVVVPTLTDTNTYRGYSVGTHCVIYSRAHIQYCITHSPKIDDWDLYHNTNSVSANYIYYKPLCYQLFPVTENQNSWGKHGTVQFIGAYLIKWIIRICKLDTSFEMYPLLYVLAKWWIWIVLIVIVLLCISITTVGMHIRKTLRKLI